MTARQAALDLHNRLAQYPWLASVGVGETDKGETIYVYVTAVQPKILNQIRNGFAGFPVIIEKIEPFRPAARKAHA